MKITTTTFRSKEWGDELLEWGFETKVNTLNNEKKVFFREGEPEDMTLGRDLSDAYDIPDMLIMAYEAGKNGEDLIIEELTEDEK